MKFLILILLLFSLFYIYTREEKEEDNNGKPIFQRFKLIVPTHCYDENSKILESDRFFEKDDFIRCGLG